MKKFKPLEFSLLRQKLDTAQLDFKTTKKIKPLSGFIGQNRALDSLNFGITINKKGYNLYAMGPTGIGKHSLISIILNEHVSHLPVPSDWCYIYNFIDPEKPVTLELPAGKGLIFQQDMKSLIEELGQTIVSVFESDEYIVGIKKINDFFKIKRAKTRKKTKKITDKKIPYLYKERHEKEKNFEIKLLTIMLDPIFNKIKKKYSKFKNVINYLSEVEKDFIDNASSYIVKESKTNLLNFPLDNTDLIKYKINVIVDNSQLKGAPVIFEETPHYSNLISRVEHTTRQGVLTTNFNLIRAGSLHRANGGYLLIEAHKLIKNRDAWEALKSALYSQKIKIEPTSQIANSIKTVSLDPEPIPLKVKIILIGERNTYYFLCQHDHDFIKLFKVPIDFDEQISRNQKNILLYTRLIASIANHENLRPFHVSAVGEIIDQSTRIADDITKLSTYFSIIKDLILESDYWASISNKKIVMAADVQKAIKAQENRMDRTRQIYYEDIDRNFIIIHTDEKIVGQINCLSVRKVGNFSYGHPTRVTARVRVGKGKLIDIQREIKLAGPMHSKAGLIISNFLASRFSTDQIFSLSASISFEQIYCWTEGDSASIGELCALLSALSQIPIKQSLAITGSIDQYGNAQAIGGVNEKIEGFFDICHAKGLTGKQGVIIPEINIKNLMLREDIVEAARQKMFCIYSIKTIDDAMILLTGKNVGIKDAHGNYTKDSIYAKVENRLKNFAESRLKKLR
ncbi:MAG TPA: ATP-binding protein [Gammaproteobacteria bacterium]|nr:ATP-binding protein [Gammaproteobacteria bacterium]